MPDDTEKNISGSVVVIISIGLLIGLFLKLFVVDILHVSGTSMSPALQDGDRLVVSKLAYGIVQPYGEKLFVQWHEPQAGDVVIYLYNNKIVVKRCVGIGGDSLAYSADSQYTVTVRDKQIPLTEQQWQNLKDCGTVPRGYIFAIGDNYEASVDSRAYGFVSTRNILGKVMGR